MLIYFIENNQPIGLKKEAKEKKKKIMKSWLSLKCKWMEYKHLKLDEMFHNYQKHSQIGLDALIYLFFLP